MGANLSVLVSSIQEAMACTMPTSSFQPQVDALVSDATAMQQDIQDAEARCTSLESRLATLQSESGILLSRDASPAMDALLALVHDIEALHELVQDQKLYAMTAYHDPTSAFGEVLVRAPLVNACKLQSRVVFGHFQSLHEKANDLTEQFTELTTDFTFQTSLAQERMEELQNMTQLAETLRDGVGRERECWLGQKAVAEIHIQQARETIQSAERKRDSRESARVVRNLLTFGIGEVFDFFDLNEEIEDAERTIESAARNARACGQSVQRAIDALDSIDGQVARLGTLGHTVRDQETTLQASVVHGQALRARTIDLTNASLDVSLFVGRLAAKSETLATHHTAQEFAQGVLSFGRLMASEGQWNELLLQCDPVGLQETLDMIAQSDGENSIARSGQIDETQQPWFAIEDMM